MDLNFWTIIASAATIVGFFYQMIRNFKMDMNKKFDDMEKRMNERLDFQDERIFQLATGKSLKEAMLEAKRKQEG